MNNSNQQDQNELDEILVEHCLELNHPKDGCINCKEAKQAIISEMIMPLAKALEQADDFMNDALCRDDNKCDTEKLILAGAIIHAALIPWRDELENQLRPDSTRNCHCSCKRVICRSLSKSKISRARMAPMFGNTSEERIMVPTKMKPVTKWFRFDREDGIYKFNHIELGHVADEQHKPMPQFPSQNAWKNDKWEKEFAFIKNGRVT